MSAHRTRIARRRAASSEADLILPLRGAPRGWLGLGGSHGAGAVHQVPGAFEDEADGQDPQEHKLLVAADQAAAEPGLGDGEQGQEQPAGAGEQAMRPITAAKAVLSVLTETIASGHGSRPNSDVEKTTGAAPTSFADFARRTAAAWAVDQAR